jgi:hypothetical protein
VTGRKTTYGIGLWTLLVFAGCGHDDGIVDVEGRVTLDGKPLPLATVEFIPATGRPSAAKTNEDGHYSLWYTHQKPGALVGEHTVRISTWGEEQLAENEYKVHPETLPAEYNYKTKLTFVVDPDKDNVANFDLVSGGKVIQPPN